MNNYKNKSAKQLFGNALVEYKKKLKLTQKQKDVLIGTLLGGASIACKKGKPVCVKFSQMASRRNYVHHLYEVFQPFVGTPPRLRTFEHTYYKTKNGQSIWFRTYAHKSFLFYENLFYIVDKKRKKRVPKNIHRLLTPRALAYWYMDDGSTKWSKSDKSVVSAYVLNTQGFTYNQQKILVCALKRLYHLNVNIHKDRHYYLLYVCADSTEIFSNLVLPYIHDDFSYKFFHSEIIK